MALTIIDFESLKEYYSYPRNINYIHMSVIVYGMMEVRYTNLRVRAYTAGTEKLTELISLHKSAMTTQNNRTDNKGFRDGRRWKTYTEFIFILSSLIS